MDDIDRKIVRLLAQDGRLSHKQLAQAVNLARPTVHERVKRLEQQGVIRGYHAQVNWAAMGYPMTALIWICSRAKSDDAAAALLQLGTQDAIVDVCHGVTGEWCFLLQVRVTSSSALKEFIDSIYTVEGVQNTMTTLSLTAYHEEQTSPNDSAET